MSASEKSMVTRARKLIAELASGDHGQNGRTDLMLKINALAHKLDRAGHPEIADAIMAEKSAANATGETAHSAKLAEDVRRAREEYRAADRARPDAWMFRA